MLPVPELSPEFIPELIPVPIIGGATARLLGSSILTGGGDTVDRVLPSLPRFDPVADCSPEPPRPGKLKGKEQAETSMTSVKARTSGLLKQVFSHSGLTKLPCCQGRAWGELVGVKREIKGQSSDFVGFTAKARARPGPALHLARSLYPCPANIMALLGLGREHRI